MVEIREKHPFDGPVVLRVEGSDRTLGERIARQIYVRKVSGNGTQAHGDAVADGKKSGRRTARPKSGRSSGGERNMEEQPR
jgi:hypothetical protein